MLAYQAGLVRRPRRAERSSSCRRSRRRRRTRRSLPDGTAGRRRRSFEVMRQTPDPCSPRPRHQALRRDRGRRRSLASRSQPGAVTGFLGPQRRRQDDDPARAARPRRARPPARARSSAAATPSSPIRSATVGAVLETTTLPPLAPARNHLRIARRGRRHRAPRVDEVLRLVGLAERGRPPRRRLLARHAPAPRPRRRAARRAAPARPRRAGQRPRPARASAGCATSCAATPPAAARVLHLQPLLAEVAQTVDDVVIIAAGRARAHCALRELEARASSTVEVRSAQAAELRARLTAVGIEAITPEPGRVTVTDARAQPRSGRSRPTPGSRCRP